jgi:phosphatidylserine/phosphatidylglycerophosphate/cardiolipin synthase-like enzyme
MRAKASKDGLTLRVIAGTNNVLLAMDLSEAKRPNCLGFSIERTDLETGDRRWLTNMKRFRADPNEKLVTSARAPLQKFRWGDYTIEPGKRYRYRVVARFGSAADILKEGISAEKPGSFDVIDGGVTVEVRAENSREDITAVFFNRGAAASEAYFRRFGNNDPATIPDALVWLSRGLQEAILAFLAKAIDETYELHAAIYEFQKPELLQGLVQAKERGVDVKVVYHARDKGADDTTRSANEKAIADAGITFAKPRQADPQSAIMHDKFVVLLRKDGAGTAQPIGVWTGSTNWTDGGIYGQLNVGHAVYDPDVAAKYESCFDLLSQDLSEAASHKALAKLTPVPPNRDAIEHGVTPIFSPQSDLAMIDLYAEICSKAKVLMVCAPFELHAKIRAALETVAPGTVRFLMADKEGSYGSKGNGEIDMIEGDPQNKAVVATVLKNPLNDFQGRLLEHTESFHHAGVHIHSKIIAADPFGIDPILVTGSANFSNNSTKVNDSNSLIIRGDTAVTDIYVTEFMRMFEHYWFRFKRAQVEADAAKTGKKLDDVLALSDDASWSDPFYVAGSKEMLDRQAFAGLTL